MEELNKEDLNKLQQFFKQRNKKNESKNNLVIDVVGPLLANIENSKLSEADKFHYNELVNALGNFIILAQQKWEVSAELQRDFSVKLNVPKAMIKIILWDSESSYQAFKSALTENFQYIVLLKTNENAADLKSALPKESTKKVWLFDTEKELVQELTPMN